MNELVRDWMTAKVISVSSSTSIDEADALMQTKNIRRLAVVDGHELIGILSLGDVRTAMATISADLGEFSAPPTVGAIMTPNPITIPETASVALAAKTMLQLKVSGLPVVDETGGLCGLLSEADLFRYIVARSLIDHAPSTTVSKAQKTQAVPA
jgi:CBS domain-containing protein